MRKVPAASLGFMMAVGLSMPMVAPATVDPFSLPDDLTYLSLEDLLNIQVTSVSRVAESISGAAASIQVVTAEDISRSGARNLPEALQLITGVQIARIDARQYAITTRGFNGSIADKLEVRLDGRSLYTALFSGVLWEAQDPPLEDIDRIEVIRGPGASLWGANAVNGVINIVTKSAADTHGGHLTLSGGDERRYHLLARHGLELGERGDLRVYAQTRKIDASVQADGSESRDAREISSAGLRADLSLNARDQLMLSLNGQDTRYDNASVAPDMRETVRGLDLIARFTRRYSADSDVQLQFNYDRLLRNIPGQFGEQRDQFDVDLRHRWAPGKTHELIWGAGFRRSMDDIRNSDIIIFDPASSSLDTFNVFLQDRIRLSETLTLTLGSKFEHNDYTGFEYQPSARISWLLSDSQTLWAALSRASRSPNRVDRDLAVPSVGLIVNDSFESERAKVAEFGWRGRLGAKLSLDLSTFYAEYDKLRGFAFTPQGENFLSNEGAGRSYGAEFTAVWALQPNLRLWLGYTYLNVDFAAYPGSQDFNIAISNQNDPRHQAQVRLVWDPTPRWRAHAQLRYVGPLLDPGTKAYTELDLHLSYALRPNLQLELTGRNLLDRSHPEFNDGSGANIERAISAGIRWDLR